MKQNDDVFDKRLAQALRDRQPYVEDEGFTDHVMAALPAASSSSALRPLLWSLLLALLTALVTVWLFPGWSWLAAMISALLSLPLMTLLLIGLGLGFGLTLLTGFLLWQSGGLR